MDTRPKLVTNIGVTRGPYSIKVQFYVLLQPQNNFLTSNVERMFSTILEKKKSRSTTQCRLCFMVQFSAKSDHSFTVVVVDGKETSN